MDASLLQDLLPLGPDRTSKRSETSQQLGRMKKDEVHWELAFKASAVTHISSTGISLAKIIYKTSPDFQSQKCVILFLAKSPKTTVTNSEMTRQGQTYNPSGESVIANYADNINVDRVHRYNPSLGGTANVLKSNKI